MRGYDAWLEAPYVEAERQAEVFEAAAEEYEGKGDVPEDFEDWLTDVLHGAQWDAKEGRFLAPRNVDGEYTTCLTDELLESLMDAYRQSDAYKTRCEDIVSAWEDEVE